MKTLKQMQEEAMKIYEDSTDVSSPKAHVAVLRALTKLANEVSEDMILEENEGRYWNACVSEQRERRKRLLTS